MLPRFGFGMRRFFLQMLPAAAAGARMDEDEGAKSFSQVLRVAEERDKARVFITQPQRYVMADSVGELFGGEW